MNPIDIIRKYKGMVLLLTAGLILSILDIYTTVVLHARGHIEWNPHMRGMLESYGSWGFVVINLALSLLVLVFATWAPIKKIESEKARYLPLIVYCVIGGTAVVNNSLILLGVI